VHALLHQGLTPSEKIGPHLPDYWTVHPTVAKLTFAHILTHSGGLIGDQSDFFQVQTVCSVAPAGTVGVVSYPGPVYDRERVLCRR
jgi:hypothetical protein